MVQVNYRLNSLISSIKSKGALGTAKRLFRKYLYRFRRLPTYLVIEVTSRCNLSCPFCSASRGLVKEKHGDMAFEDFKKIINELTEKKGYLPNIQLALRGEPLLNKDISKMIGYAVQRGLSVIVNTNGTLLNSQLNRELIASGLNHITISVDGASEETYESLRVGGNFRTLLKNITDLLEQKERLKSKTPFVELQFIVSRRTENEIPQFLELADTIRPDNIMFKTLKVPCSGRDNAEELKGYIPSNNKYSRYKINGAKLVKKDNGASCPWGGDCLIYFDGVVGPCCEDFSKKYPVGNVFERNFWEVWNSPENKQLRARIKRKGLAICKNCS